tara:strand:- start:524 stop:745 length:222 start_codon:yes stop_codon:yes gene_type:complete
MKTINLFSIYILSFMFFYFSISAIGILWTNYTEAISNPGWFIGYTMLIGWWMAILPAREYYMKHKKYFDYIFD